MSILENTLEGLRAELAAAEHGGISTVEEIKTEIEKVLGLINTAQKSRTVQEIEAISGPAGIAVSYVTGLEEELAHAKATGTGDVKAIEAEIEKAKAAVEAKKAPADVPSVVTEPAPATPTPKVAK